MHNETVKRFLVLALCVTSCVVAKPALAVVLSCPPETIQAGNGPPVDLVVSCQTPVGAREGPVQVFFPGGKLRFKGTFRDDKLDGEWVEFFGNGKKRSSGIWKSGRPAREWTFWHPNGEVRMRGDMYGGNRVCNWLRWDENGNPTGDLEILKGCTGRPWRLKSFGTGILVLRQKGGGGFYTWKLSWLPEIALSNYFRLRAEFAGFPLKEGSQNRLFPAFEVSLSAWWLPFGYQGVSFGVGPGIQIWTGKGFASLAEGILAWEAPLGRFSLLNRLQAGYSIVRIPGQTVQQIRADAVFEFGL